MNYLYFFMNHSQQLLKQLCIYCVPFGKLCTDILYNTLGHSTLYYVL